MVLKVALYIILVLSFINLNVYPESHSKYITSKNDALIYNTNLYQLNQGSVLDINLIHKENSYISDHKTAYLKFSFNHSNVVTDDTRDRYNIIIPDSCSIVKITTQAEKKNKKKKRITYYNYIEREEDKNNTVILKCTLKDSEGNLNSEIINEQDELRVPVTIEEVVGTGTKEEKFTYMKGTYIKADYHKDYPTPPIKDDNVNTEVEILKLPAEVIIENENPVEIVNYDYFKEWLENYAKQTNYYDLITEYVSKGYPNKESILKTNPEYPGIIIKRHETEDNEIFYEYQIDENLIGYARTYQVKDNFSNKNKLNYMYFSSEKKDKLEEALKFYLKNYAYSPPEDKEKYESVVNYIENEGGISSIILSDNKINGLTYNKNLSQITLMESILDHIYNKEHKEDKKIRISFDTILNMRDVFRNNIDIVFGGTNGIVSQEAIKALNSNSGISSSISSAVIKNNTNLPTAAKAFNDYFTIYDSTNEYYLLINVYSDGQNYNYVTINKIDYDYDKENNQSMLEFTNNSDNTLTIKIKYNETGNLNESGNIITDDGQLVTDNNLSNVVKGLKEYFKQEPFNQELKFVTDSKIDKVMTYSITKTILNPGN